MRTNSFEERNAKLKLMKTIESFARKKKRNENKKKLATLWKSEKLSFHYGRWRN